MEVKVNCLKNGCYECCRETEMQLSQRDVKRLERLGYRRDEFSTEIDGVRVLKNVNGWCFFLENGKCRVYSHRPLGCRLYPVVYSVDSGQATVHDFCPLGKTIRKRDVKRVERILIRHISEIYGFLP